ncbi:MAG: hypothetical protein K2Q15_03490, partial [Burkholderiales bacterium]|nr:hypothetical protein [Burkholderiales bacterium]
MSATQLYYILQWPKQAPPLSSDILEDHILQLTHWLKEASWAIQSNASIDNDTKKNTLLSEDLIYSALLHPNVCNSLILANKTLNVSDCINAVNTYRTTIIKLEQIKKHSNLLGKIIEIDFDSEDCYRIDHSSSVLCHPPLIISEENRQLIQEKLTTAMAMVDHIASTAGLIIRKVTRVIRIRCADNNNVAAETDPNYIGEIRLLNPHLAQTRIIDIADSLIHESLHNFLAMYENRRGNFVAYEQNARIRPVSPWTGNPIPYNAFTHAVFIYFALFNFYRLLYASNEYSRLRTETADLIAKCARGFRVSELYQCL